MYIDLSKDELKYLSMLMQLDNQNTKPLYQYSSINIDEAGWYDLLTKFNKVRYQIR